MFIHVFFLFPETASKPLEEVEEIFNDSTPGSFRYIGTPAWKTHVDRNARRLERGEIDPEEKFGLGNGVGNARHVEGGHVAPEVEAEAEKEREMGAGGDTPL